MLKQSWVALFVVVLLWSASGHAEDPAKAVKKAVERSTLDQLGTKPFHLKAVLAPGFERDKDSGRIGEVEIWWVTPTQWKREVRSPAFHQIEIVDGDRDWQRNEGDYFPEWLRQTAVELIKPVPPLAQVLAGIERAEIRHIGPMTHMSWTTDSGTAEVKNVLRSSVAVQDSTGLLLYASGFGWGGEFKNYAGFRHLMIARTVNVGTPQVTAKVTTLEDLGEMPAGFFDATAKGEDTQPIRTLVLDETTLRKNLLPMEALSWPQLKDGPLSGKLSATVAIDRQGKIREIGPVVSDNPELQEAGKHAIAAMRFQPLLLNGAAVQAMSQITIPFKSLRPAGAENFPSAHDYFEHGRRVGFPAARGGTPYVMRAEFETRGSGGALEKGRYEDTWVSETQWRREAWFGQSRYVRARNGDKTYQWIEGPNEKVLRLVLKALEPIPAIDTFVESDWKIKRDMVNGSPTVRVLTGYESPDGQLDAEQASAYWFDDGGLLVKSYFWGIETQRSAFEDFAGAKIAHQLDLSKNGKIGMRIHIAEISAAGPLPEKEFAMPGHEWNRAFTDEVR